VPAPYDMLIKGGTVIDPAQDLHAVRDVGIAGGRVAAVDDEIYEETAQTVIDAAGYLVTPGLIDLHVHVWWGVSHYGVEPDPTCLARGVTTVYDTGSSGADTFPGFKKYVIDASATRIKAFLHLSSQGMLSADTGELTDLRFADVGRAVRMCEEHKDDIVGVKIRMTTNLVGENGKEGLKRARQVCDATGLPLMIHPNASPVSFEDMMDELRPGDIVTHCFHQSGTGILDDSGAVRPAARRAAQNGILFDVGHGQGSFAFDVAEAAMSQDFPPGTISSDLHVYNLNGPVYDLVTTVSKFLVLGLSPDQALEKVTAAPARAMGMLGDIGTLRPGATADLAILELKSGSFVFSDALGQTRPAEQKLEPVSTIRGGRLYAPSAFDD
jgi:dihydroorotase